MTFALPSLAALALVRLLAGMPPRTHRSRKLVSYSRAHTEVHLQRARHGISDYGQCPTQLAIQKNGQPFSNVMLREFVESRCRAGR